MTIQELQRVLDAVERGELPVSAARDAVARWLATP